MTNTPKTVIMLYGDRSFEHDVSVISAVQIDEMWRHDLHLIPVYLRDGDWYIVKEWRRFASYTHDRVVGKRCRPVAHGILVGHRRVPVDCALLLTHGGEGEDGTLQSLLRYYGIPYTSCDCAQSAVCMDKILCKRLLQAYGFPVVAGASAAVDVVPPLPCIVKPAMLGSSLGIGVVRTPQQWAKAYYDAAAYDSRVLAEDFLPEAVEYTCAAMRTPDGVLVSEVERPIHEGDAYDFVEKYKKDCRHELPAVMPPERYAQIQAITRDIYTQWHLKGVVRIDFLWQDALYVNEINTIPGALAYRLFAAGGLGLSQQMQYLLQGASCPSNPTPPYGTLLAELIGVWK